MSEERFQQILEILSSQGSVRIADLAKRLNISEMSIRRDLILLEKKGYLWRTHGGAINTWGRNYEPPLFLNLPPKELKKEEKKGIAKAAADLVQTGDFIALDIGTTALEIAKMLGVESLGYLSVDGMKACTGLPDNYCAACFDGVYPDFTGNDSTKTRCG